MKRPRVRHKVHRLGRTGIDRDLSGEEECDDWREQACAEMDRQRARNKRQKSVPIDPIARFDEGGELIWNEEIRTKIRDLAGLSKGGGAGARDSRT